MSNAIKFIKNKLCKTSNKELYFENLIQKKLINTILYKEILN